MIYEVINPSDKMTLEADDPRVAACAGLVLGGGKIGLRGEDDSEPLPLFLFAPEGAVEAWAERAGLGELGEFMDAHREAIADCLDSIVYGDISDRRAVLDMFEGLSREEINAKLDIWNDRHRTSLSDYSTAGRRMAADLRKARQ